MSSTSAPARCRATHPAPWWAMRARAAMAVAACLTVSACALGDGGGVDSLKSLPLDGTPGAGGGGAARSSTGHYFVRVIDAAGTTVRLVPGAAAWQTYGTGYGSPSAPQHDGSIYVTGPAGGSLMQVQGAEYVDVRGVPAVGAQFLSKTEDGRLHMLSSAMVDGTTSSYTFWSALPGDAAWRNDGSGTMPTAQLWMTSKGRVLGWRRNVGIIEVEPSTRAQTTLVACGQPGATDVDCVSSTIVAVPDRRGHFYFTSRADTNGYRTELWRVAHGSTTATRVAGPGLPQLPKSDGASNYYRPGDVSLYADPSHRIWMAFRWGSNGANDTGYLYRFSGSGWSYIRGDLSRNVTLFGEGDSPGILGITLFGSMQVWRFD